MLAYRARFETRGEEQLAELHHCRLLTTRTGMRPAIVSSSIWEQKGLAKLVQ